MGVVEWLKFYFLGFFSEKQARKSNWTGALTIIFSAVLAFLLFFIGFYAADIVPFSTHYNNATQYCRFVENAFDNDDYIAKISDIDVNFGTGKITVELTPAEGLFYDVLSKQCDLKIENDFELVSYIKSLGYAKKQYDKLSEAVKQADEYGYGVVIPADDDMNLDSPEIVKRGSRYGVRLKASAPSYHIMKVDVETEVNPIMSEAQDEKVLKDWLDGFGEDNKGVWKTNMLGRSLDSIAKDSLASKLASMPADTRSKLRKTVNRIINEGKGGVLCILL